MAWRCELCGKAPASGHNVSHSMRHTKRRFKPNLVNAKLMVEGEPKRLRVCTRCLRTFYRGAA